MIQPIHDPTKIGFSTNFDQDIWAEILKVVDDQHMGPQDIIDNFVLFLRRVNFARYLAHIEIFKKVVDVPGAVVECGVFKGQSLLTFTKLIEVLCPGDTFKKVIGFDTFSGFTSLAEQDGAPNERRGKVVGGWNAGQFLPALEAVLNVTQKDSMIPRFKRVELVKGDVCRTIPEYVRANPGLRIALLHIDLDLYEPTKIALEHLYPLVVAGGVVIIDEYAMADFPGESAAFDEYFGAHRPKMQKFPYIPTPGGFFVKES